MTRKIWRKTPILGNRTRGTMLRPETLRCRNGTAPRNRRVRESSAFLELQPSGQEPFELLADRRQASHDRGDALCSGLVEVRRLHRRGQRALFLLEGLDTRR